MLTAAPSEVEVLVFIPPFDHVNRTFKEMSPGLFIQSICYPNLVTVTPPEVEM